MEYFSHFNKQSFWRDYYQSKDLQHYDWLQNYNELIDMFRIACQDKNDVQNQIVLDMGCGTSCILENLYKQGYNNLIGIDYCKSVIEFMNQKYQKHADKFFFYEMNALKTNFEDKQFDMIIDKGLFDCWDARQNSQIYLKEVDRILKNGGKYILITHGDITQRKRYLNQIKNYNEQIFKLYRTTPVEETKLIRDVLLENDNKQLEQEDFCKILNENISTIDTEQFRMKNFHYGIIFEKPIEDRSVQQTEAQQNFENETYSKPQEIQLISNNLKIVSYNNNQRVNERAILLKKGHLSAYHLSQKLSIKDQKTKTYYRFAYERNLQKSLKLIKEKENLKRNQIQQFRQNLF